MQSPLELVTPIALTFGGCCSNVFTLESVLRQAPQAGSFLTFIQFLFVACQTLPGQLTFTTTTTHKSPTTGKPITTTIPTYLPRLKTRTVPLRRWAIQVVLFLSVSWLNNHAFSFNIPVPVHIIFRSGGLAVSMLTSYLLKGRRYSVPQVVSVLLISAGVILATLSAPPRRPRAGAAASAMAQDGSGAGLMGAFDLRYLVGIGLLALALFLSALMGLFQQETYEKYGDGVWKEGLFYSHFLSLPLFAPLFPSLPSTVQTLNATPPLQLSLAPFIPTSLLSPKTSFLEPSWLLSKFGLDLVLHAPIPAVWVALAVNVLTQAVCVGGVNRLTAKVSSLTTSLVLTLRKAVSLVLSVWWFSGFEQVGSGLITGGSLVLLGTLLYSLTSGPPSLPKKDAAVPLVESKKDR